MLAPLVPWMGRLQILAAIISRLEGLLSTASLLLHRMKYSRAQSNGKEEVEVKREVRIALQVGRPPLMPEATLKPVLMQRVEDNESLTCHRSELSTRCLNNHKIT